MQEVAGVPAPAPTIFARAYATTIAKARLHQAHFRRATLIAYKHRCCVCELREPPLLDAAHIIPDRLPDGVAMVRNGLGMCPGRTIWLPKEEQLWPDREFLRRKFELSE